MPSAKSAIRRDGTSDAGRVRVRGRASVRSQDSTVATAGQFAEITVGAHAFRTLSAHQGGLRKVLTTYAGALEKAERLGRPLDLVIRVHPDRTEPAVEERDVPGDALDQALAAARQRAAARVAEIMTSPDMLSGRDFAPLIGASHETVNQKRKTGELLALDGAKRGFRYPSWQITEDGRLLPGLVELARELSGGPWTIYRFLLQRHPELNGETGLDALKNGRVSQTLDVARGIAQGTFA